MLYQGIPFDKKSRIISCKHPFQKDPTQVNYELDSQEEWEDMIGDNLEDDDMLLDEENMEVFEDEAAEKLNMPSAGVSNSIKQTMAFRSHYCMSTLQYKGDDPDLRKEGFIVADDYCSQASSEMEFEDDDREMEVSRKELLRRQLERERVRLVGDLKPYILLSQQVDLGDYKAISLRKKVAVKKPIPSYSRLSMSGASTSADEAPGFLEFPLNVEKLKKAPETKLGIKDVIDRLVEIGHGSSIPKKLLQETFKREFSDLKKSHVEVFVKECFKKEKLPLDSKVRNY